MHVLVIGGTRFVGPLFVFRLLAGGHRVTLFNRGTRSDPFGDRVERLVGDRTTADLSRHMCNRQFDAAVDFAAYRWEDGRGAVEALGGRVGHYVYISSGQVYLMREDCPRPAQESDYTGPLIEKPTNEADLAQWEYGMGKRDCEDALVEAWQKSGFPATRLRLPIVAGERDHYQRLDPYVYRLLDGGPIIVPDGGMHPVRHVYAGEVARLLVELLGRESSFGEAYNVCQREAPSLSELVGMLAQILGSRSKLVPIETPDIVAAGFTPRTISPFSSQWMSLLDPFKAETELGFRHEPLFTYLGKIVASLVAYARATPPDGYERRVEEIALAEQWLKDRESVRPPPSIRFS
ncbi:MAG: NAD-dependent epimerase/dehydratase family protein [Polyangiaceae bacterium]|nr:NAD-dependent epimerase/dehydratase family protein [Polyangiaceae bacterium]